VTGEISVPMLGESVLEATVGRWLKQEGQPVTAGEVLVELETEKVNAEVAADRAGVLERIVHREGETVHPGDVLGVIREGDGVAPPAGASPAEAAPAAAGGRLEPQDLRAAPARGRAPEEGRLEAGSLGAQPGTAGRVPAAPRATPIAERLAAERRIDLSTVQGSGPGGRITREDVERAGTARPETRQRLSRRRLTIGRRLVEAQHAAAMLTTFNEIDMSAVIELRAKQRQAFKERYGVDLGYMSFFTKASIAALKAFPQVNAELDGEELVIKRYYDVGIAIGDPEGLVVPVLRNAQDMTFAQIEQAIAGFVQKAREKTLTLEDLRGGTFTITNGGVYGSLMSTPILNPPQVAILGLHKIEQRPIVVDSQVAIRPMMYVALSYDHRVVDGREAVQFLVEIKRFIEQPELLLLDS
jgi:2-oxoglutarate dehydrogenase E2 component (dihydrolipoamide succinyltransferase)